MIDRISHIDKSIEEGYYPAAINQIKQSILSEDITEKVIIELNKKLLSCLDAGNFDFDKRIKEIQKIINNEELFNKFDNNGKSNLYEKLGDNFFEIGDMSNALVCYYNRFSLGNSELLKAVIYMSIYLYSSLKKDNISKRDSVSHIIEEIEKYEDLTACIPNIKSDMLRFFYGEIILENSEYNLMQELYNLEAKEQMYKQDLYGMSDILDEEVINNTLKILKGDLGEKYEDLFFKYADFNILTAKENMQIRMDGKRVNFSEYSNYIREFISIGFGINEKYLNSNNQLDLEKSLYMIDFLTEYGMKNLDLAEKSYLINFLHRTITQNDKLADYYLDGIKNILYKNVIGEAITPNDLLLLGDIFLRLGDYEIIFENYKTLIALGSDVSKKIEILLEDMLLNKEFIKANDSYLKFGKFHGNKLVEVKKIKMDPEIEISLLLEKLKLGNHLTEEDYNNIAEMCRY